MTVSERPWWQRGVIYQLIVPSFFDSNADGLGDLQGIVEKLDYLRWLGVDGIWLSPFYASPLRELGYDVTNHCDVDRRFGSLEVFDRLVSEAHRRDLRLILDWVGNHTSSDHEWFRESRSSRDNPKRDWYIWEDPGPDGSPPNNWISVFGGSAWEWDEATGQYYLHTFLKSQPDLNWRNPAVADAMHATLYFWLDRGADGFRLDAPSLMLKDEGLRDNPPNPNYKPGDLPDSRQLPRYTRNQPGMHFLIANLRAAVDARAPESVLLGEFYLPIDELVTFYGRERPELHLPVNLTLTYTDWDAGAVGKVLVEYHKAVPEEAWPTTSIGTHDQPRIAARTQGAQPRVAAMLLFTQRGTPTLYYGDEVGMRGVPIPPESARDPQGRRTGQNRDPERTPMQWSTELHAGFSSVEPWLPIADDFRTACVAAQSDDPKSLLSLCRRLIELRKREPLLVDGAQELVEREPPIVAYRRTSHERAFYVLLNLGHESRRCAIEPGRSSRVLLSTFLDRDGEPAGDSIELRGDEGVIVALE
jgi:alpha-glucosidase